jgi:hypothetical protein
MDKIISIFQILMNVMRIYISVEWGLVSMKLEITTVYAPMVTCCCLMEVSLLSYFGNCIHAV